MSSGKKRSESYDCSRRKKNGDDNEILRIKNHHNFRMRKSLGQNFLTNKEIIALIIEGSGIAEDDLVIEIGPGFGVLTAEAAKKAHSVVGVELDRELIPILKENLSDYDNIKIINNDILKTDIGDIIQNARDGGVPETGKIRIIGNLPYYITTPIIMKLLENDIPCESISIMVQKEVGERLLAEPGGTDYGSITIAVGYRCNIVKIADVPSEMFLPRPKVDSMVIMLVPRKEKAVKLLSEDTFFTVVRGAFSKRRKTLLNSLTGVAGLDRRQVESVLSEVGIDCVRRAETLSIAEFAALSNRIYELLDE